MSSAGEDAAIAAPNAPPRVRITVFIAVATPAWRGPTALTIRLARAPRPNPRPSPRHVQPPLTHLTWWRMTLAAGLLQSANHSLSEIATRVGYSNEYAFSKAFRRELGTAPSRYRAGARAERTASRASGGADGLAVLPAR